MLIIMLVLRNLEKLRSLTLRVLTYLAVCVVNKLIIWAHRCDKVLPQVSLAPPGARRRLLD
jgi:hypothetical protein